jgi:uncharacterized SAM-binding protein YcdF (DUF218 family)
MSYLLYSPLTWVLLLGAVLPLLWSRLGTGARVMAVIALVSALALLTPFGGNALVRQVESRIPAGMRCADVAGDWSGATPIVLLSAGFETDPATDDPYVALAPDSWRRLRAAVLLWQKSPDSEFFISGGGPFAMKESTVLVALARDWGVPAKVLHAERHSTTTWESAFALRDLVGSHRIRVVSSALHLPRALIAFRAAGFQPCAQPSDSDYQPPGSLGYYLPQRSGLRKSEMAIYEILGTGMYRYRAYRLKRTGGQESGPAIQGIRH